MAEVQGRTVIPSTTPVLVFEDHQDRVPAFVVPDDPRSEHASMSDSDQSSQVIPHPFPFLPHAKDAPRNNIFGKVATAILKYTKTQRKGGATKPENLVPSVEEKSEQIKTTNVVRLLFLSSPSSH